jgi:Mrp family chromosome partitioning ATPase
MKNQDSFSVIRTTIEAEIASPGVLSISSARDRDGKTAVAAGIARSLAGAGYNTLIVDAAGPTAESIADKLGVPPSTPVTIAVTGDQLQSVVRAALPGCDVLALNEGDGSNPSAVSVNALFAALRAKYDYVIVDSRTIADGGAIFARCADGVVLAVREGRAATASDSEAVALLDRVRARFLGVVATAPRTGPHAGAATRDGVEQIGHARGGVLSRLRDFFAAGRSSTGPAVGTTTPE